MPFLFVVQDQDGQTLSKEKEEGPRVRVPTVYTRILPPGRIRPPHLGGHRLTPGPSQVCVVEQAGRAGGSASTGSVVRSGLLSAAVALLHQQNSLDSIIQTKDLLLQI